MTLSRSDVKNLLAQHGLSPSRALGQNFVVDPNTVRRIAKLAGVSSGDHVLEIGAGLGSLTLALIETGATVKAVELDRYLLPVLRDQVEPLGVVVVEGDAMELDWPEVLADSDEWTLVANLPYNVSTPLVLTLLDNVPQIKRMLVMVQLESGERLVAEKGSKAYGIPSVKVAYWASAKLVGKVPPSVFVPRPKVDSALVEIVRREQPATTADPERLFALVRAGFAHRRKMLRGALGDLVKLEDFEKAEVSPQARAEELSVEDWGRLAGLISRDQNE
ncbi:MAG: 16S rRNA (adenine(1518)-N(6)/adenine(1519)-N(6))-dimethyltransferase RsmA [Acidimicrobiia bacterium]